MSTEYTYKHTTQDQSEITLEVEVSFSEFLKEKEKTLQNFAKEVKIKGFRKGHAPKNFIESAYGQKITNNTLNKILPKVTAKIVEDMKMSPITPAEYEIKELTEDNGLKYIAKFVIFPDIILPDLKQIKIKREEVKVTEEDIDKVIIQMLKDTNNEDDSKKEKEFTLKDATDEWIKKLNLDNVKNISELRDAIAKNIENQRKIYLEEKYLADLLSEVVEKSKFKIPEKIVELELKSQESGLTNKLKDLGMTLEEFTKAKKLTPEELKKQWEEDAKKKISTEIVLFHIVKQEKLKVEKEEIDRELDTIKDTKTKQQYSTKNGKDHIRSVLLKQKALKWLKDEVNKN